MTSIPTGGWSEHEGRSDFVEMRTPERNLEAIFAYSIILSFHSFYNSEIEKKKLVPEICFWDSHEEVFFFFGDGFFGLVYLYDDRWKMGAGIKNISFDSVICKQRSFGLWLKN